MKRSQVRTIHVAARDLADALAYELEEGTRSGRCDRKVRIRMSSEGIKALELACLELSLVITAKRETRFPSHLCTKAVPWWSVCEKDAPCKKLMNFAVRIPPPQPGLNPSNRRWALPSGACA